MEEKVVNRCMNWEDVESLCLFFFGIMVDF